MTGSTTFICGLDVLLERHRAWLHHRRLGLVAHGASRDQAGRPAWDRLAAEPGVQLAALFGPEHGYLGQAGAGDDVPHQVHPTLGIPVFSLYGPTRRPTPEMLTTVDVLLFDLQDLPIRCYTYSATLQYLLEAAAANGKTLIVADRPAPLPNTLDGPPLDPACASFVGLAPVPVCYGLTSGELALYLRDAIHLDVDLRVARMDGYSRQDPAPAGFTWTPPSPGIRTWMTAELYPVTVFLEAFAQVDYGRGTEFIFQQCGWPGFPAEAAGAKLAAPGLPGVDFQPCTYTAQAPPYAGRQVHGLRLLRRPGPYHPIRAAVALVQCLQEAWGRDAFWTAPGARPGFFDQLMGHCAVREGLQAGADLAAIWGAWDKPLRDFAARRNPHLQYGAAK